MDSENNLGASGPRVVDYQNWEEYWDNLYKDQSLRTRTIYDFFDRYEWFLDAFVNKPHLNTIFPQKLSYTFLKEFLGPGMYKRGVYGNEEGTPPEEVMCRWLTNAYKALAVASFVEPDSIACKITRVILDNITPLDLNGDQQCKPVAYIDDDTGEVVFAQASRLILHENKSRIDVLISQNTPFPYNIALKDGFRKVICALEKADGMMRYMRIRGHYLADKETAIIPAIQNLHRAGKLSTPEQINSFDFKKNILGFILEERPILRHDLM